MQGKNKAFLQDLSRNKRSRNLKIHIATIGKTVGLKGGLKFYPDTDFLEQFSPQKRLTTEKEQLIVEHYDAARGLIFFEGYNTKEKASLLTGFEIFTSDTDTKQNIKLAEGEFFWFELSGMDLYEDGVLLGSVTDIERIPPMDYLRITISPHFSVRQKTLLVPYDKRYIIDTDLKTKKITVCNVADLIKAL